MNTEARNKAVLQRWFDEVWNAGRKSAVDELFASGGIAHGVGEAGRDLKGPAAFLPFVEKFRAAFPNPVFTVHDIIAQGDTVAARWSAALVHGGDDFGLPATGRQVEVTGMSFVRIRNGQIVDAWNNWDLLTLMTTIGAPAPGVTVLDQA